MKVNKSSSSATDVRTHVILPVELVEEVDELVGNRRRSHFFAEAVSEKLARLRLVRAAESALGSLTEVDVPGWETAESTKRWVSDLRAVDKERLERLLRVREEA